MTKKKEIKEMLERFEKIHALAKDEYERCQQDILNTNWPWNVESHLRSEYCRGIEKVTRAMVGHLKGLL